MRPLFLLLLLCACDNGPFLEPVQSAALVQGQPVPADCRATCREVFRMKYALELTNCR